MEIFRICFSASVFILAIVIVRALALHRLPKRTFLVLWAAALCRLLIPISIPSRLSVYTLINMLKPHFSAADTAVTGMAPLQTGTAVGAANMPLAGAASGIISPFMIIWLIGVSVCALFFLVTHLRCRREYKTALPIENEFVSAWQRNHPIRRKVEIRQSDRIAAPLTYGIFRPVILLPRTTDWTHETRLRHILAHEHAHIRRFDTLTKLLLAAAVCIHWFNPFAWVMYVLANRDIELTCDEMVVRTFGETMKSAYALTLIGLEDNKSRLSPLVNNFSRNAIEERIVSIMKMKKTSVITIVIAALIVSGVTMGFATAAKSAAGSSDAASVKESPAPTSETTQLDEAAAERLAKAKPVPPSAEPVTEEALPAYWKMGALNIDGVPYLPLVATAEDLGYTVNVVTHNVDPNWDPKYPNAVEHNYEMLNDGKSLGIASLVFSDGVVVAYMIDGIYCNTNDKASHTSIILQEDTVYMPAQFFKEALDTGNTLP